MTLIHGHRTDISARIGEAAQTLTAAGITSFDHQQLLSLAFPGRLIGAGIVQTLRKMIFDGDLIAHVDADGAEYMRSRGVSSFAIDRATSDDSRELAEIRQLGALTISVPAGSYAHLLAA